MTAYRGNIAALFLCKLKEKNFFAIILKLIQIERKLMSVTPRQKVGLAVSLRHRVRLTDFIPPISNVNRGIDV